MPDHDAIIDRIIEIMREIREAGDAYARSTVTKMKPEAGE
jgi:hypothetical protein